MYYRLHVQWTMVDIALYSLLWLVLILVTAGIALLFAPYAWTARVLNGTQLLDSEGRVTGTVQVVYSLGGQTGHILKWLLLTIITAGFAYPFYFWGAVRSVIDHAQVVGPGADVEVAFEKKKMEEEE
ncbi:MAG: hypothetical protein OXF63_11110 [Anaerolineaceae bacterium]|nr:hypothetical protein [Anaerolineaceae bacterium]